MFEKPRLNGRRRTSGSWPPSKYGETPPPERAFWPLVPRPAVLPWPEPWPRPTRLRFFVAPSSGRRSCSFMFSLLHFFDSHQVLDLGHHTANLRRVGLLDSLVVSTSTQRANRILLLLRIPDRALHQGNAQSLLIL